MEPTIYKPSIYKGAGIYKTGAGGGGIFDGNFELDINAIDLTKNQNIQCNTIITFINKENLEKIGNKLIIKNSSREIDLAQHVDDDTSLVNIEIKYNILGLGNYGYIGSKFITSFCHGGYFQNFGVVVSTTGLSDFITQLSYNTSWDGYSRYAPFTYNTSVTQKEEYIKGGTSSLYVNNENICSGKYSDSTIFFENMKIQSQENSAIIELEKLKITWS